MEKSIKIKRALRLLILVSRVVVGINAIILLFILAIQTGLIPGNWKLLAGASNFVAFVVFAEVVFFCHIHILIAQEEVRVRSKMEIKTLKNRLFLFAFIFAPTGSAVLITLEYFVEAMLGDMACDWQALAAIQNFCSMILLLAIMIQFSIARLLKKDSPKTEIIGEELESRPINERRSGRRRSSLPEDD